MYPILLEIGRIKIYTYGVFIAFAFIIAAEYAARVSRELKFDPYYILDIIIWMLIGGILGTRIAYIIMNIKDYIQEPVKILKIWEGGLAWYGGIILSIILGYIWSKKNKMRFLKVADVVSLAVILGLSIGRWGCFSAGCCYGKPTEFALGVIFKNPLSLSITGIKIHPTQIYEALGMFFSFSFIRGMMIGWLKREREETKITKKRSLRTQNRNNANNPNFTFETLLHVVRQRNTISTPDRPCLFTGIYSPSLWSKIFRNSIWLTQKLF
jgi:Prolipoprotein diacylglyceryltransferase